MMVKTFSVVKFLNSGCLQDPHVSTCRVSSDFLKLNSGSFRVILPIFFKFSGLFFQNSGSFFKKADKGKVK